MIMPEIQAVDASVALTNSQQKGNQLYESLIRKMIFLQFPESFIESSRLQAVLHRVHYSTALEKEGLTFDQVKSWVSNNRQPMTAIERDVYGYFQAEQFLFQRVKSNLDVYLLNDMQRVFFAYPGMDSADLFTQQLFQFKGLDLGQLLHGEWPEMLESLQGEMGRDPVVYSWILHLYISSRGPFGEANGRIGRLLQFFSLLKHNRTLSGLLEQEQVWMRNKERYQEVIEQAGILFSRGAGFDREEWIPVLDFGRACYHEALRMINRQFMQFYRQRAGYEDLTPRYRLAVNYCYAFGELLFESAKDGLNERQQEILRLLYLRGVIATRDLYAQMDVNRKTIQRDFTFLEELGLVRSFGSGAGVCYVVPLKQKTPDKLQAYQALLRNV